MLKRILNRISGTKRREQGRKGLAARLLADLESRGSLVLDKEGLEGLGISKKQAFQVVYDLVIREKAQMRADNGGRVVVMSNREFADFMRRRAEAESLPGHLPEDVTVQVKLGNEEFDAFEVAPAASASVPAEMPEPVNVAIGRQSLPERKREPWIAFEDINLEAD